MKLFKKRNTNLDQLEEGQENFNPFKNHEKDVAHADLNPPPLNPSMDMPDGLGHDLWNKLVEYRDKKIVLELEVFNTGRYFKEMQSLVQMVLEESERLRVQLDKVTNDIAQFKEYRFRSMYNIEILFGFKQGQVEIPQMPIVTNYTDAVLVHRSVVENLNEQVKHLGQLKVEALTEMKEYRKGIHALEW